MADPISLIVSIANKFFVDLGVVSLGITNKVVSKGQSLTRNSIFSTFT